MFLAHAPVAHAINIQKIVSPRGITAWLVADHSNPIITVSLHSRGARQFGPYWQRGSCQYGGLNPDEGAGDLDSQAFQQELGGSLRVSYFPCRAGLF